MSGVDNIIAESPLRPWAGKPALQPGGNVYAVAAGIGQSFDTHDAQEAYLAKQTRISTATDSNLDIIATDYLGPTYLRGSKLQGTLLVPESDPAFSARLRNDILPRANTTANILAKVQEYIDNYYVGDQVAAQNLLGADTAGGLGTVGGLDGRPVDIPPIPNVTVFDRQSNRKLSDKLGLVPGDFCVLFTYGGLTKDGFFLGRAHLGRASHLTRPKLQLIPALNAQLDAIVEAAKVFGTRQLYADNRGA